MEFGFVCAIAQMVAGRQRFVGDRNGPRPIPGASFGAGKPYLQSPSKMRMPRSFKSSAARRIVSSPPGIPLLLLPSLRETRQR